MNKNEQKQLAKQKSFIAKLSRKQIVELLNKCGYILNTNVYSEFDDKKLPAIETGYINNNTECVIFIRAIKVDKQMSQIYNAVKSNLNILSQSFNPNETIIMIKDFEFCEVQTFLGNSEQNNQKIFANFMYNLFGEYYRTKYNNSIRKQIKEQQNENSK